jgi:hypothetical protein
MMDNGFCLLYRFGKKVNLSKYLAELNGLGISMRHPNDVDDLLQQFDFNTKSYRKVEPKAVEGQFNSTGLCCFLLWMNDNNITVTISSPREGVILECYDIEILDNQCKQRFMDHQIIRFSGFDVLERIALVGSFRGDVDETDWDCLMLEDFEEPEEEPDVMVVNKGKEHRILSIIGNASVSEFDGVVKMTI